jgi:hypothetical protein
VPAEARVREVLTEAGAPQAADLLFQFMWAVVRGAVRPLTIACVCKPGIGSDERLLLDVIALHQRGRSVEAMVLLRSILRSQAALVASDNAERLAAVLLDADHWLAAPLLPTVQHSAFVPEVQDAGETLPVAH